MLPEPEAFENRPTTSPAAGGSRRSGEAERTAPKARTAVACRDLERLRW
jgi:hypothetical protein